MSNLKLMQPQEIEVLYVLPALRREFSLEMKKLGFEQKKIAKLLCVTEAAVSQYIKLKRASKVEFSGKMSVEIKAAAKRIVDTKSMLFETQHILTRLRDSGFLCKVHRQYANVPGDCADCFTK